MKRGANVRKRSSARQYLGPIVWIALHDNTGLMHIDWIPKVDFISTRSPGRPTHLILANTMKIPDSLNMRELRDRGDIVAGRAALVMSESARVLYLECHSDWAGTTGNDEYFSRLVQSPERLLFGALTEIALGFKVDRVVVADLGGGATPLRFESARRLEQQVLRIERCAAMGQTRLLQHEACPSGVETLLVSDRLASDDSAHMHRANRSSQ